MRNLGFRLGSALSLAALLLGASSSVRGAEVSAPGKTRPRPTDWSIKSAEALNGGAFVGYFSFGAPFVGIGAAIGIARRLNVGVSLKSVYTIRNSPELDLKLNLIGPRECHEAVGGRGGISCHVTHALGVAVSGGYMLGGTVARTTTFSNGETSYRLSGLPTYIDDANHLRITPSIIYSYRGGPFPVFTRAQVLIQKFLEDDPTGTPRDAINLLPELVAGMEIAAGTRLHFWLEGGMGTYLDWNHPVEGVPLDTERRITLTGHVEAGLALYVY